MSLPWQLQQAIKDPFKKGKQQSHDPEKEVDQERQDTTQSHIIRDSGDIGKEVDLGNELSHKEVVHDHDVLGGTNVTRDDAMHMGELTPEELVNEKKLRRKIDTIIMPLVMMVCCI